MPPRPTGPSGDPWPAASVTSPPPTSTISSLPAPSTTVVLSRCAGPSIDNAAAPVSSLTLDAGTTGGSGATASRDRPVARSTTSALTLRPSPGVRNSGPSTRCSPAGEGIGAAAASAGRTPAGGAGTVAPGIGGALAPAAGFAGGARG